jgi:hypothetical protein
MSFEIRVRKYEGRGLRAQPPANCAQGESLDYLLGSVEKASSGFAASLSTGCKKLGRPIAWAPSVDDHSVKDVKLRSSGILVGSSRDDSFLRLRRFATVWDLNPHSLTAKAAAPEPVPMITPVKEFATRGWPCLTLVVGGGNI